MSRLRKKLSIMLSIILVILSSSGLNAYAGENEISVYGANGNATQIEKGTSMKMAVSGISQGKSVTWSVTDLDGSATSLATITQTGAQTAILTASSESYGTFKVVAEQNGASGKTGEQIIQITNENLITVDDNDALIKYESAGSGEDWETNNSSKYYQGTGMSVTPPEDNRYSSSEPAYAEFTFTGTGIQWIGESNYDCGIAEVYLDGIKVSTVDPFIAPCDVNQFINFSREGLPYGEHTIKVAAAGLKNPASTVYPGTRVLIDAFRYMPGSPTQEVNKAELRAKITEAQALSENAYTPESWAALQQVLITAVLVNEDPNASQEAVDAAASDLAAAILELVPFGPTVVLSGVDRVLPDETFSLGVSLYHVRQDVYAEFIDLKYDQNVFEYVNTEAENSDILIVDVESDDGYVSIIASTLKGVTSDRMPLLQTTFKVKSGVQNTSGKIEVMRAELGTKDGDTIAAGFTSKTISVGSSETVDKSLLSAAIDSAKALYEAAVVGDRPGQYPQAAKDALKAAIDAAELVLNDSFATQTAIDNAVNALNTAVSSFKDAVIKEEASADLNDDEKIDVVDLAIVAYYYGKTSDSPDWDRAKAADVNRDGKIDISDLAYVALRIVE
ncbi:dockerin type I domain-containing protein [Anoxybacterium hadale]|uniref:dockerin type I domain-containing protein n=1 Tax=Anoxybacterium hadale TaxID=3408580 RepID=UPI003B007960